MSQKIVAGVHQMLAQTYLKQGALVPMHAHPSEQMTYVLQGALKFRVEDEEIIVREGEVLHIPANTPPPGRGARRHVSARISTARPAWTDWPTRASRRVDDDTSDLIGSRAAGRRACIRHCAMRRAAKRHVSSRRSPANETHDRSVGPRVSPCWSHRCRRGRRLHPDAALLADNKGTRCVVTVWPFGAGLNTAQPGNAGQPPRICRTRSTFSVGRRGQLYRRPASIRFYVYNPGKKVSRRARAPIQLQALFIDDKAGLLLRRTEPGRPPPGTQSRPILERRQPDGKSVSFSTSPVRLSGDVQRARAALCRRHVGLDPRDGSTSTTTTRR